MKNMDDHPLKKIDSAYLFGSRHMMWRPATNNFDPALSIAPHIYTQTDYDYVFPIDGIWRKALIDDGFTQIAFEQSPYPWSQGIVAFYKRSVDDVNIQAIIRNDYDAFCSMWKKIDVEFWYNYLWKRSPRKPDRIMRHAIIEQLLEIEKSW